MEDLYGRNSGFEDDLTAVLRENGSSSSGSGSSSSSRTRYGSGGHSRQAGTSETTNLQETINNLYSNLLTF